jgi:hypothetical protein
MPARITFLRTLTASTASLMLLAAPWSAPSARAQQGAPPDQQQQQPAAQALERIPVTFEHSRHAGRSSCILVG